MGKKKLRKKITSKGIHSSMNAALINAVRADKDPHTKLLNKIMAWSKGQNPWITIANPSKEQTNKRYIRVRANEYFGPYRNSTRDDTKDDNNLF